MVILVGGLSYRVILCEGGGGWRGLYMTTLSVAQTRWCAVCVCMYKCRHMCHMNISKEHKDIL